MCNTAHLLSIYQQRLLQKLTSVNVEHLISFKIFTKFISYNVTPKKLTSLVIIYFK